MRYILDDQGYVEIVSCNPIECESKSCTEYKGLIPLGYYSLEEWAAKANIRAYKIVDGTLTYDAERAAAIEAEMKKGFFPNKFVSYEIIIGEWFGKPLYRKVIDVGTVSTTIHDVYHGIDNLETVVNYWARCSRPNTIIQNVIPATYAGWEIWLYDFTTEKIRLRLSDSQFNSGMENVQVILEYTKTTDEAREEENFFEEPDLSIDANIPVEPDIPTYTIANNWVAQSGVNADGTLTNNALDAWISASNTDEYKGIALDFTLEETHNLKATFEFEGYEGCPRYQVAYIIKDGSEWLHEFTMRFDSSGNAFTRTINQVLEAGSYQLVLGSWGNMDFGVKCNEISLTTEIPTNLFDLSSYSFPVTKDGLTFNYDNTKKSLLINGYNTDDFGLYIPLSIPAGNYTFSYQPNQTDLGFYFSIDEISASQLTGWGKNNKTFDVTSTTSQIILWFDAGYTYNNLELSFNLVKND